MLKDQLNPKGKHLNLSDVSEYHNIHPNQTTQHVHPFFQGATVVFQDAAELSSVYGPQLMVSETRTRAVLALFKIMVTRGK